MNVGSIALYCSSNPIQYTQVMGSDGIKCRQRGQRTQLEVRCCLLSGSKHAMIDVDIPR